MSIHPPPYTAEPITSPRGTSTTLVSNATSNSHSFKNPPTKPETNTPFKSFTIRKSGLSDLQFSSTEDEQEYHFSISLYNPKKRDVVLHLGTSSKDPVVGEADLKTFSGHYMLELGDHSQGPEPVISERLDKVKNWSSRHQFSFSFGGSEKEVYIWRHKGERFHDSGMGSWEDMELVTDRDDDEEEVVVAQYFKREMRYRGWKGRGMVRVREGVGLEWERMGLLSLVALLVTGRREQPYP